MATHLLKGKKLAGDKLIGSLALMRASILPDDFISSYIPFVASLICEEDYHIIDVDSIVEAFSARYGFKIPRLPMISILQKCTSKKFITKTPEGYTVDKKIVLQYRFKADIKNEALKYDTIISQLQLYAETNYSKKLDDITAHDVFLSFLEKNSAKTITFKFSEYTEEERKSKQNMYIVSEFIANSAKTDYSLFSLIKEISFAHMMASAITYSLDIEQNSKSANPNTSFKNLTLYLDTPFILRLLGLNTDEMQVSSSEFMDELKSNDVKFKVFGHTYDEALRIVRDCEYWIENPLYEAKYASLALRNFVSKKFTKVDVSMFISNFQNKLAEHNIEIDDLDYYHHSFKAKQINELLIRDHIISTYKQNNANFDEQKKAFSIDCDVRSISHILKLWPQRKFRSYFDATCLFLTTNSTLSYATRKYTSKNHSSAMHNVYPCVTDVFLGTVIWLNSPIDKIEDFNQKKLLADCMAAISPSEELIKKLSESIEAMHSNSQISSRDYYLLKLRAYSQDYLQKKTLNDENAFNDKITEEILEEIKAEMIMPINDKLKIVENNYGKEKEKNLNLQEELTAIKTLEMENQSEARSKEKLYESIAEKKLNNAANAAIPVGSAFIIFLIILIINVLPIPADYRDYSILLKIISGVISVIAACVLALLKTNNRFRAYMLKHAHKKAKIKDYTKSLK